MFTDILSKFVGRAGFEQLPMAAVDAVKRGIMDFLGVALAGSREDCSTIVAKRVREQETRGEASVINAGFRADASLAAYVNGTMAHALDYDDVIHADPLWMGHPSVAILPAVLAVTEKVGGSGRDVILGYSVGVEAYAKIGLFCGDAAYKNGWHNTSFIGTMAAAAASARLLKLEVPKIKHCFGIAASMAGGLRQNFGTMTKPLHAGIAAKSGVEAALLAQAGLTANDHIFEAPLGFRHVFNGPGAGVTADIPYGLERISNEAFAQRLGNPWSIESPGLTFKICPSCRATHFGMEAALNFRRKHFADLSRLDEIECHVPNHMGSVLFYHKPEKGLEGKFSLEYVIARTLLDGIPKIEDFTDARITDAMVGALIKKIKWLPFEPQSGEFGVPKFVFKLYGGETYETAIKSPMGEPDNPVPDDLLVEKFHDCARSLMEGKARERITTLITKLDRLDDLAEFAALYRTAH